MMLTALAATTALALAGCGLQTGTQSGGDATSASSRIVIGSSNVAETLDPQQASDAHNDFNVAGVYDRLVDYDAEGKMIPKLATAWAFNSDATQLTLTLRDGVLFHSGNAFTADDVVYTLDRVKKIGSGVASFLSDYVSSTAPDAKHVVITLSKPDLDFIGALSPIYILDSKTVKPNEGGDDAQGWLGSHEAGSGPFSIATYKANQELDLTRYAKYWDYTDQRPATLILRMISDHTAGRDELLAGNLDITMGLNAVDINSIAKNDKYEVVNIPASRETYAWLNMQGKVTGDARVREAIQLAYDYSGHLSSALGNQGSIATEILPEGISCRVDAGKPSQDLAKAKQLVDQAGVSGATVTVAYQPTVPEFNAAGTILQDSLKKIGLNANLVAVTFPQYSQMVSSQSTMPDIALAWDFAAFPAAGPMLQREWDSNAAGKTNFTWYSNPKVDQLLQDAQTQTSADKACQDYTAVQKQVLADRAMLYIANPSVAMVSDKKVQTIPFSPTQQDFNVGTLRMAG
jgi:peptide/nickel transport system substrate-binding protein